MSFPNLPRHTLLSWAQSSVDLGVGDYLIATAGKVPLYMAWKGFEQQHRITSCKMSVLLISPKLNYEKELLA